MMHRKTARYKMSDLVHMTRQQLDELPRVPSIVVCDDGEVECIVEEIILSHFLWEFHRVYPNTPHLVRHVMSNLVIHPDTHCKYLSVIQKDAYIASRQSEYDSLLPYNKLCYQIYNNLYNFMAGDLLPWVTSISILDYLEVLDNPKIAEVNEKIRNLPNVSSRDIAEAYAIIKEVLDKDPTLRDNPLSVAFRHRIVSLGQLNQVIGPRGFVSDIDSHIFRKPILTNYSYGITELADYISESRTGSMAQIMTGDPMRESEYLNRLLQLSVSRVKRLHKVDCGSTVTSTWTVDSYEKLTDLEGMYYVNEDTGVQEPIVASQCKHLVGRDIQLRTIFGCQIHDRDGICAKCFGDLAYNILDTDNIGHISAIEFQSGQTQQILSYKHLTSSAGEHGIYLDEEADKYFIIDKDTFRIKLKPGIDLKGCKFKIDASDIRGFEYLSKAKSWEHVSPPRLTFILGVTVVDKTGFETPCQIADPGNRVYATIELLQYLFETEQSLDKEGVYTFDMSNWDNKLPLFGVPKVQFDPAEYAKMLETFIKGSTSTKAKADPNFKTILDYNDPVAALMVFHDLVGQRLRTSVSHLQVILLSSLVESKDKGDYRLPKDKSKGEFVSHMNIMRNSSAVVALGFELQERGIFNPDMYMGKQRPSSQYDYLFLGDD